MIITGVGLFVGLACLLAPTSSPVAGLFLDELAEIVEREIYPPGATGHALLPVYAVWLAIRFALVSALVNFIALMLLLCARHRRDRIPCLANAYLFEPRIFRACGFAYRPLERVRLSPAAIASFLPAC